MLLNNLVQAVEENNSEMFSDHLFNYNQINTLDPWKTEMLLRVKNGKEIVGSLLYASLILCPYRSHSAGAGGCSNRRDRSFIDREDVSSNPIDSVDKFSVLRGTFSALYLLCHETSYTEKMLAARYR